MNRLFGTAYYMAPEVLKQRNTEKCDLWSVGAMTYTMICGYPPFNCNINSTNEDKDIFQKILKGKYEYP